MSFKTLKWCFLFGLLINASVFTAAKPTIALVDLGEGLQTQNYDGFYAETLAGMVHLTDIDAELSVRPFKRALVEFQEKKQGCIWPFDIKLLSGLIQNEMPLIETDMLFVVKQHVFTALDSPVIHEISELNELPVAVSSGTNLFEKLTAAGADLYQVPRQDNKALMLEANRVSAVVGWAPDLLITFRRLGLAPPHYDKDFDLESGGIGVVCHDTPENKAMILALNRVIATFKDSADFKIIIEKYGISALFFGN